MAKAQLSGSIQHIVIIVKENHGFDNYFGLFPGANGMAFAHSPNPPPHDPDHRHQAWLSRKTSATRAQFNETDIPAYFAYARQFTLCDRYFTDVAGPSTPNHLMLIAGDSPVINNPPAYRAPSPGPLYDIPSMPGQLEKAGLTWGNYGGYAFAMIKELNLKPELPSEQFAADAQAGRLPAVSWVYAPHESSEHPPDPQDKGHPLVGNVTNGMQWTVAQVNAIVQGGLWPKTVIFITWDDWGGWFDHVDPPEVEKWAADGSQFRYGSRVPCLVLSPYARPGHISSALLSHTSLLKFCADTFGLPALNSRVAGSDGMTDCFNFKQSPLHPPAAALHKGSVTKKAHLNLIPAVSDYIRIVPLHGPEELFGRAPGGAAPAPARLTYRGGPLLSAVEVFTVFWGEPWTAAPLAATVQSLNDFFRFIVTSALMDQLGEYSVPAFPIRHGSFKGSATIAAPAPGASVTDSAIQHMLQHEAATNEAFPHPDANLLYFVYLPPGVSVIQGGAKSCQAFCGYHNDISGQIFYAVMPYANCNGCLGGLSALEALTSTSSHELSEAITDPIPGRGWYDDANGEIGDICAWHTKKSGAYTIQLEWSNKANQCI